MIIKRKKLISCTLAVVFFANMTAFGSLLTSSVKNDEKRQSISEIESTELSALLRSHRELLEEFTNLQLIEKQLDVFLKTASEIKEMNSSIEQLAIGGNFKESTKKQEELYKRLESEKALRKNFLNSQSNIYKKYYPMKERYYNDPELAQAMKVDFQRFVNEYQDPYYLRSTLEMQTSQSGTSKGLLKMKLDESRMKIIGKDPRFKEFLPAYEKQNSIKFLASKLDEQAKNLASKRKLRDNTSLLRAGVGFLTFFGAVLLAPYYGWIVPVYLFIGASFGALEFYDSPGALVTGIFVGLPAFIGDFVAKVVKNSPTQFEMLDLDREYEKDLEKMRRLKKQYEEEMEKLNSNLNQIDKMIQNGNIDGALSLAIP